MVGNKLPSLPEEAREPTFKPIFGKVVIKIDNPRERVLKGGIILPPRDKMASNIGTIIAVYEATETPEGIIKPEVSVGDMVLFGQFTGTAVTIGRSLYVICREHDLLSVLEYADPVDIEEVVN